MSALAQRRTAAAAAIMMLFAVLQYVLFAIAPTPAGAAGGDFSLDFAAAAPLSYNHTTGGGAWDDKTIGVGADVVESLEGGDFTCGDIVTYLQQIVVDAGATGAQSIEMDYEFLANSTGQPGVAHADVVGVQVNGGVVQDLIEGNHVDTGMSDDGGSVASIVSESFSPAGTTPFAGANTLDLTVAVTDLEASEHVIIRIDVELTCDPGARPTGNLQAALTGARVTSPTLDVISAGNQTIPFKQVNKVIGTLNPAIDIEKTPDNQSVVSGSTVTFNIWVKNTGDVDLTNVAVTDVLAPNCDKVIGALAVGEVHTYDCTLANVTAGFTNVADVVGTPPTGPDVDDTDDAVVTVTPVATNPSIDIEKTPDNQSVVSGSTVTFNIWVKNTGDVDLTSVTVTDVLAPNCEKVIGALAVGEVHTYDCTLANVTAGFTNVAVVVGTPPTGPNVDDTDGAIVTVTNPPPNPPSQPTPTGSIGDYVWLDANANGRQDDNELPAAGVKVELLNSTAAVLATAVTDVNGGYLFSGLVAGTYQVRFTVTDTVDVDYMFTLADSIDSPDDLDSDAFVQANTNVGLTQKFVLGAGANDLTRDAGLLRVSVQGIQIEPTTTTTATPTTVEPVAVDALPFTGVEYDDIVKLALLVATVGSALAVVGRRERQRGAHEALPKGWKQW